MPVFAVIQWEQGRPVILSYHRDRTCPRIDAELHDPELDKLRQVIRDPDQVHEVLTGDLALHTSEKVLTTLEETERAHCFRAPQGTLHLIAPCRSCVDIEAQ